MFNNIGRKIKGLAKFLFWIVAIISILGGLAVLIFMTTDSGDGMLIGVLAAIGIAVGGFILAWLQNFLLYGFGELIDSNQKILKVLEEKKEIPRAPAPASTPVEPVKPAEPTTNF